MDRRPPLNFNIEEKLLLRPFSLNVKCFTGPSFFAGNVQALLFRKWKNKLKGRVWYDLEWYIKKGIFLDLSYVLARAKDTNDWQADDISPEQLIELLQKKLEQYHLKTSKKMLSELLIMMMFYVFGAPNISMI